MVAKGGTLGSLAKFSALERDQAQIFQVSCEKELAQVRLNLPSHGLTAAGARPLAIDGKGTDKGCIEPWNRNHAEVALKEVGTCTAGGHITWVSLVPRPGDKLSTHNSSYEDISRLTEKMCLHLGA